MILHTVNKSPSLPALASCLQFIAAEDAMVLLEDGVYAGIATNNPLADVSNEIYAISADVSARGLDGRLADHISVIDYAAFVTLCTQYKLVKNWS